MQAGWLAGAPAGIGWLSAAGVPPSPCSATWQHQRSPPVRDGRPKDTPERGRQRNGLRYISMAQNTSCSLRVRLSMRSGVLVSANSREAHRPRACDAHCPQAPSMQRTVVPNHAPCWQACSIAKCRLVHGLARVGEALARVEVAHGGHIPLLLPLVLVIDVGEIDRLVHRQ